MKSESDLIQTNMKWKSSPKNLSHLHTCWAPFIELACIVLNEPLPEGWEDARRNSMFKQVSYPDFLPILEKANAKPSFIPDYMGLFQPDLGGWIIEFTGQQRTMKEVLFMLSYLSPLLDTQCTNIVLDNADHYDVRLNHVLFPDGENALSLTIQVAVVMSCVNKLYWTDTPPRDVEIAIPTGPAFDMARSALSKYLPRQRWPAYLHRWDKRSVSVRVPKYDRNGNVLKLTAPLRGTATPGGRASPLYKEVQAQLWGSSVFVEACAQRWMLCNVRDMSLDRYCEWLMMTRPTVNRKLKEHGLIWGDLKAEVRYRWHFAQLATGYTEQEAAAMFGCSVSEQRRWLNKNAEAFAHAAQRREADAKRAARLDK